MNSTQPDLTKILSSVASVISLGLLLQIAISHPLWQTSRSFPLLPILDLSAINLPLLVLSVGSLLAIALFPRKARWGYWIALLSLGGLILSDLNRLQVWVYLQMVMLLILAFRDTLSDKIKKQGLQCVVATLYIWGGIHKFNIYFVEDIFPWLLEPLIQERTFAALDEFAIAAAAFELLIGLLFLFGRFHRLAFQLSLLFHLSLLLLLGPFGHNWNAVIWPWNLTMIIVNYFLFYVSKPVSLSERFAKFRQFPIFAALLLFFMLSPGLNKIGCWHEQLSFKMYAGIQPEGILFFDTSDAGCIAKKEVYSTTSSYNNPIPLDDWAFSEMGTPFYISERTIKQVGKKYCECFHRIEKAGVEVIIAGTWSKKDERILIYPCLELLKK